MVSTYIIKYWPGLPSDFKYPEASEPITYDIFNSEEKAKRIVGEFPFMFYDRPSQNKG